MKKLTLLMMIVSLVFIYNHKIFAQKDQKSFSGIITYSLSYQGELDPEVMAQQPKELILKVNGNKSINEFSAGGVVTTTIKDGDKKQTIILMDISMLGKKIMYKTTADELTKEFASAPTGTIKYFDETKDIAGYKCKKGELTVKDEDGKDQTSTFYYTDELGVGDKNFDDNLFKDVKGTLMEFEKKANNLTIKEVVTKVKKQKISEKEFMVPEGYEEMTLEQLKSMFGGAGN